MLVWLVDDDLELLESCAELLKTDEEVTAINVSLRTFRNLSDFELAVGQLGASNAEPCPDVIFLDLKFRTQREGYIALDLVKNHEFTVVRSIPTIMFSSASNPIEVRKAYRKSVNSYLEKGANPYERFRDMIQFWHSEATLP